MNSVVRTIYPDAQRASYVNSGEVVKWTLDFPNKKLVANSLYLSGNVRISNGASTTSDGTQITANTRVYYDSQVGMHNLFDYVTVSKSRGLRQMGDENKKGSRSGTIERIEEYGRWVKMNKNARKSRYVTALNAQDVNELCCFRNGQTNQLIHSSNTNIVPFALQPDCCLNNMRGNLSYQDSGSVMFEVTLNKALNFLYGEDNESTNAFKVTDLRLHYRVMDDDGQKENVSMRVVEHARHTMNSSYDNYYSKATIPAHSIVASYQGRVNESNVNENNLVLEDPILNSLLFSFNDQTNKVITYRMRADETSRNAEYWVNALEALGEPHSTAFCLPDDANETAENNFMVGVNMGQQIDFRNNKLGIESQTELVSSTDKYNLHIYFIGDREL